MNHGSEFDPRANPAAFIDHTLLRPTATAADIARLCEEAVEYGFVSVCVPPRFVAQASQSLYGSGVLTGTVIGFPLGYASSETKVFETREACALGAAEIDLVIPLGAALAGDLAMVEAEIARVVAAAQAAPVKVILECCYLTDRQKAALAEIVVTAGAAYVKTSTGFGSGGATLEDVRLLRQVVGARAGVKAAGGIRDLSGFDAMCRAGASRIGSSAGVAIVEAWRQREGLA